jgi:hypothetical protein
MSLDCSFPSVYVEVTHHTHLRLLEGYKMVLRKPTQLNTVTLLLLLGLCPEEVKKYPHKYWYTLFIAANP